MCRNDARSRVFLFEPLRPKFLDLRGLTPR
nr:MAG TPA_asm: hypothetical protein [Caudoviricetes sp.]